MSGSFSKSNASSSSHGISFSDSLERSASQQRVAFEDVFSQLYGGASNVAAQAAGSSIFQGQAQDLYSGGMRFLDTLSQESPLMARLADTGVADQQIASLGSDLGRFFSEELNPAITSRGVASGTLGGGRQGVAQAKAASSVAREFAQGATAIRAQDVQRKDTLAGMLAQDRLGAAQAGIGALSGLYGIAEGSSLAGLSPYMALSQILGGPTVLGESASFGTSSSFSEESSQSKSKSKSTSGGIGSL